MRTIVVCVVVCYLTIGILAIDEHRPKKKSEERGKRNLEYQISNHYSNIPSYRLERRIATGFQYQNPPQFYPRSYRKGRPQSYPAPPYAVQMEPLIHYSQRDPLYDTNILPLDSNNGDLLTENNLIQENIDRYGYHKPQVIERPVYIKEPEPIIEIIIKESNVSLPAPPPPPPPPKKKKEQVQVFYVKYKKNPNGYGKDSIVYDKPVPAISPNIPDEEEPEHQPEPYYPQATVPPPPSTTLRTIIKPDSEFYHSPSGVKVTFGKEGFDYDKRSSKLEDYVPPQTTGGVPQGRQLSSFSNAYYKRPNSANLQTVSPGFRSDVRPELRPDNRPAQPYRTINLPQTNYKPFGRQTGQAQSPNFSFQQPQLGSTFNSFTQQPPNSPQFAHSISHPPPARFQAKPNYPQGRQPVPYKPFENFRPQQTFTPSPPNHQPLQFRPETHFPIQQQLPLQEHTRHFNPPRFNQQYNSGEIPQQFQPQQYQQLPEIRPQPNFRQPQFLSQNFQQPQQHIPQSQKPNPPQSHQHVSQPQQHISQPQQHISHPQQHISQPQQHISQPQQHIPQPQQSFPQQSFPQNNFQQSSTLQHQLQQQLLQQQQQQHQQPVFSPQPPQQQHQQTLHKQQQNLQYNQQQNLQYNQQQNLQHNEHLSNLQTAQNILPPGGQLIPSVSKYETHISSVEPLASRSLVQSQNNLTPEQYQQKIIQQFNQNSVSQEQNSQEVLTREHTLNHQKRILEAPKNQQNLNNFVQNYSSRENFNQLTNPHQKAIDQQNRLLQEIARQRQQQEQLRQFYIQNPDIKQEGFGSSVTPQPNFQTTRNIVQVNSTPRNQYETSTSSSRSTTTTTQAPLSSTTKDPKELEAQLPDEVPEDLRQQLLSSGILDHASISVLDYDKVGDIPISALPPDQLANFYGAGGAAQLESGSDPVPAVVHKDGTKVENHEEFDEQEPETAASEFQQQIVASPLVATAPPSGVEMKVVRYDPETDKGQQVQEKYIEEEAQQVNPVVLNDSSYNRYLPLKINGTQFPIPDVPELKGKKIFSVVVLAPISYDFSSERKTRETTRELSKKNDDIELIEGTALKELLRNPSSDNFKKFLESENKTSSDKQAVILLVADSEQSSKEKEIYMYDVATQSVSKLNGELSSAFVEAAEANSSDNEGAASSKVERSIPFSGEIDRLGSISYETDLEEAPSEILESKVPIIDPLQEEDMETQASEHLESFVDISGEPVEDLMGSSTYSESVKNKRSS